MKQLALILIAILFTSCNCCVKNKTASNINNATVEKKSKSAATEQAVQNIDRSIIKGRWKLTKINMPWDVEPTFPSNEIWHFDIEKLLIITKDNAVIDSISYTLKRSVSGFSRDSVWIIIIPQANKQQAKNLEIQLKDDKMQLIEPSDDGYAYDFERLE